MKRVWQNQILICGVFKKKLFLLQAPLKDKMCEDAFAEILTCAAEKC